MSSYEAIQWACCAKDDGWLEPHGKAPGLKVAMRAGRNGRRRAEVSSSGPQFTLKHLKIS